MQRLATLAVLLSASCAAHAVTNLPIVCNNTAAAGQQVGACAGSAQRYNQASGDSLVRVCDVPTCTYTSRVWRYLRDVQPTQFVEVCAADKAPGSLVNECQGTTSSTWGAMRMVAPMQVTQAIEAPFPGTFTVTPEKGLAPLTVDIAWDVSSLTGGTCEASGSWTGTKPLTGRQTVNNLTANASYTLTCTRTDPNAGAVSLSWTPPTTNTDGTALANLAGYRVHHGSTETSLSNSVNVANPDARGHTVTGLKPGTHFFGVKAFTSTGAESALSNVVGRSVSEAAAQTHAITRTVTVEVAPSPPTGLSVVEPTAYRLNQNRDRLVASRVGVVPLATPCDETQPALAFHRVARDRVTLDAGLTRPNVALAKCAKASP